LIKSGPEDEDDEDDTQARLGADSFVKKAPHYLDPTVVETSLEILYSVQLWSLNEGEHLACTLHHLSRPHTLLLLLLLQVFDTDDGGAVGYNPLVEEVVSDEEDEDEDDEDDEDEDDEDDLGSSRSKKSAPKGKKKAKKSQKRKTPTRKPRGKSAKSASKAAAVWKKAADALSSKV
jgi:hypothetical protein